MAKYSLADKCTAILAAASITALGCSAGGSASEAEPGPEFDGPGVLEVERPSAGDATLDEEVDMRRALGAGLLPSDEVGALAGVGGVDGIGNATYSIPFAVPPGPGGMTPELSLSYNSGRGPGLGGLGLELDGFGSIIKRCDKTIASHGEFAAVSLSDDDALCFDGKPMVLVEGSHGQAGAEYRTRRNPFDKIVLTEGDFDQRESEWEVWLDDGRVIGFSPKSEPGDDFLAWYADSVRDRYGNALEFGWYFDGTSVRPDRVTYGGGREVRFEFLNLRGAGLPGGHSDRQVRSGFVAGKMFEKPYLLKEVSVFGRGGVHLWDYRIQHDVEPGTQQSLVRSVEHCDAAGACLPATEFTWDQVDEAGSPDVPVALTTFLDAGEGPQQLSVPEDLLVALAYGSSRVIDVDGDGVDEVISSSFASDYPLMWQQYGAAGIVPDGALGDDDLVEVDALSPFGFPGSEDPLVGEVSVLAKSAFERFAGNLAKRNEVCSGWAGSAPPLCSAGWSFLNEWGQEALAQEVAAYEEAHGEIEPGSSSGVLGGSLPGFLSAAPGLTSFSADLFGERGSALVFPISPRLFDETSVDANGIGFVESLVSASEGEWNTHVDRVVMRNHPFDTGGRVFSVTPVDHDGNGLTDLWMCRGADGLRGTWVLGLNNGDDPGPGFPSDPSASSSAVPFRGDEWAMSLHDTGVRCSAFDELEVLSLRGTSRQSLLVSPAYSVLLDPTSSTPLLDSERDTYFELQYSVEDDVAAVVDTALPRDRFQRWHDSGCRNAMANGEVGFPSFGAGQGHDRLMDINGDGLTDILRFELASGDDDTNLANIQAGMDSGVWDFKDSCESNPGHQDSLVRIYLNQGGTFEAQPTPFMTFDGIPHADFWLTWMNALVLDVNSDTRSDLLMLLDPDSDVFTVKYSRPDGSFDELQANIVNGWPHYMGDDDWQDQLYHLGTLRTLPVNNRGEFLLLGDREPTEPGIHVEVSKWGRAGHFPRVAKIEDGMGAAHGYTYGSYVQDDTYFEQPAGPLTAPKSVVSEHTSQIGPGDALKRAAYSYTDPVRDGSRGGLSGFGKVSVSVSYGDDELAPVVSTTVQQFDLSYDKELRGFPYSGRPSAVETTFSVPNGSGELERYVTCDFVDEWDILTPDDGKTWFSYASEMSVATHSTPGGTDCGTLQDYPSLADTWKRTSEARTETGAMLEKTTLIEGGPLTRTSQSEFTSDPPNWFEGRPEVVTVTSCTSAAEDDCETRTEHFAYDAEFAVLDTETREPGGAELELVTQFFRSPDTGRIISTTSTAADGEARTLRVGWDADGTHVEWTTNAAGHKSYKIHDAATGALIGDVEPNGLMVETSYDGFLRPVRTQKRMSPVGTFSPVYQETTFSDPGGAVAMRVATSTFPTGQRRVQELGPTGKTLREEWDGVVSLQDADFGPFVDPATTVSSRVEVFHEYDNRGRELRRSKPTWVGEAAPSWTQWEYDDMDRKLKVALLGADKLTELQSEAWAYQFSDDPLAITTETYTDHDGETTVRRHDVASRIVTADDGEGTPTYFEYGPFDHVAAAARGATSIAGALALTTYEYDRLGRRKLESDTTSGVKQVFYSAFGDAEVLQESGRVTYLDFDVLGRTTKRVDTDGESTWVYDTDRIGALTSSLGADGIARESTYDAWGRVESTTTTSPLGVVELGYGYDDHDRLTQVDYPEPGLSVFQEYDVFGYHRRSRSQRAPCSLADAAVDWEWVEGDPAGNVVQESFGNGAVSTRTYEPGTYRPEMIQTLSGGPMVQNLLYGWSAAGDLDYRTDFVADETETFGYDHAHRLTSWSWGGNSWTTSFDPLGNITHKSGQGAYQYDSAGKLTAVGTNAYAYDTYGNVLYDGVRALTWTAGNKVRSLQRGGDAWSVSYDAAGARVIRENQAANEATYNLDATYELRFAGAELSESRISVLGATGRVVAEVFSEREALAESGALWESAKKFVHDDHLGSVHTVTSADGTVESRVMYGAWGEARNGGDWNLSVSEAELAELPTGYTGHQPELDAGLINMRGRMYDPVIGRFLSIDPVIENPLEVGTWNPYSYVLNRPLSLVDPTGLAAEDPVGEEDEGEVAADDGEARDEQSALISVVLALFRWLGSIAAKNAVEDESIARSVGGAVVGHYKWWLAQAEGYVEMVNRKSLERHRMMKDVLFLLSTRPLWLGERVIVESNKAPLKAVVGLLEVGIELPAAIKNGDVGAAVGAYSKGVDKAWTLAGMVAMFYSPKPRNVELGGGGTLDKLSVGEIRRIQNAANRSGVPVTVVGSRVNPAKPLTSRSDYDYVINANSKIRNNLSRSLPGAKDVRQGNPGNLDVFKGAVDSSLPHATFRPMTLFRF